MSGGQNAPHFRERRYLFGEMCFHSAMRSAAILLSQLEAGPDRISSTSGSNGGFPSLSITGFLCLTSIHSLTSIHTGKLGLTSIAARLYRVGKSASIAPNAKEIPAAFVFGYLGKSATDLTGANTRNTAARVCRRISMRLRRAPYEGIDDRRQAAL